VQTDNKYLSLAEAAREVPGRPSPSTLWRWATRGVNGVTLRTWRFGDRFFTTREELEEFGKRGAEARKTRRDSSKPHSANTVAPRTDEQRDRDVQRATKAVEARGV